VVDDRSDPVIPTDGGALGSLRDGSSRRLVSFSAGLPSDLRDARAVSFALHVGSPDLRYRSTTMNFQWVEFQGVTFAYELNTAPLLDGATLHFPLGWTGIVGANGAGKTTVLRLATGELRALRGSVQAPASALYCPQRTDDPPPLLDAFLNAADGAAAEIQGRLGVRADWLRRWDTLSHGERKRAQIAVALWRRPEVLAIDEPTNHLDAEARDLLGAELRRYRGVGLLVSHDRELLDSLCAQCLFVDPPEAVMRPGNYSQGAHEAKREADSARRIYEETRGERRRLERELQRRREAADQKRHALSKRDLDPKDHDAKGKIDLARVTGKDAVGGKLMRQLRGRLDQARLRHEGIRVKKTCDLGIWIPGARSPRDFLFHLPTGRLPLGESCRLEFPDLSMRPNDRVALTGSNGAGKSTLVRRIVEEVQAKMPAERLVYVPQEIALDEAKEVHRAARRLARANLGRVMTVVSCLGSRPAQLLETEAPSPGELRKLLLALGIAREPYLIVMDEPTNHLDLPSIECVEDALEECPCALLLVSHDRRFLGRLTHREWRIAAAEAGACFRLEEGACFPDGPILSPRTPPEIIRHFDRER
jgi:ATPase subunit of ABC transporter with duplicated ATPase domains